MFIDCYFERVSRVVFRGVLDILGRYRVSVYSFCFVFIGNVILGRELMIEINFFFYDVDRKIR